MQLLTLIVLAVATVVVLVRSWRDLVANDRGIAPLDDRQLDNVRRLHRRGDA